MERCAHMNISEVNVILNIKTIQRINLCLWSFWVIGHDVLQFRVFCEGESNVKCVMWCNDCFRQYSVGDMSKAFRHPFLPWYFWKLFIHTIHTSFKVFLILQILTRSNKISWYSKYQYSITFTWSSFKLNPIPSYPKYVLLNLQYLCGPNWLLSVPSGWLNC